MNKLLALFILIANLSFSQTIIRYDYMETWDWPGLWQNMSNVGWSTSAFVSSDQSAILYGNGNGTSPIEGNTYVLPNVSGLDVTKQYQFRFRLASYTFTNPSAATRGVDIADYVSVLVSTNGGSTYVTELRITGNSNSQFPYTSTGTIMHTANGSFTNSPAPTGDVYQAPAGVNTTGPSTVSLDLPIGITQAAIAIYCRVNSAGEEWWFDNLELVEFPNSTLPVELTYFTIQNTKGANILLWQTASEHNSDYFLVEKSTTGEFNENSIISIKQAAGHSTQLTNYACTDYDYSSEVNYYRLTQVDIDGVYKIYGPISVDNTHSRKEVVKLLNTLGQPVDNTTTPGIYIEVFDDGTSRKIIR